MLREALASIEQVRNENLLEVIVVDDGSSEVETTTILSQVEEAGCCVVRQSNRGLGVARNAGIRRAKGEFILVLGSDNRLRVWSLKNTRSLNTRPALVLKTRVVSVIPYTVPGSSFQKPGSVPLDRRR